ncbi:MAG: preprotein translocase subunit SecG [Candidatus Uhrbacteria bacterium]|nr:preprotein translocase subunit SecG [Candidatus Uhrbacteria bacterium]
MALNIIQITLAILLIAAILVQARSGGLGAVFGGEGNAFRTKRGIEKKLHTTTIALAILFLGISLANVIY